MSPEAIVVILVMAAMLAGLFFEMMRPELLLLLAMLVVWNAGIISSTDALAGFSNEGMITVGALFVVVKGVDKSGIVDRLARKVFGSKTSKRMGLLRMQLMVFVISAFINNTPIVALLLPITRDWARSRGFAPSQFLIPLSYITIAGGLLTIIGSSTNLVVQGLLQDNDKKQFGFFDPALIALPTGAAMMIYLTSVGQKLLPEDRGGMFRLMRDRAKELITEVEVLETFPLIGKRYDKLFRRLQLPASSLLKIRRRCKILNDSPTTKRRSSHKKEQHGEEVVEETKDMSRVDPSYVRRTYGLWYPAETQPDNEITIIERRVTDGILMSPISDPKIPRERPASFDSANSKDFASKVRTATSDDDGDFDFLPGQPQQADQPQTEEPHDSDTPEESHGSDTPDDEAENDEAENDAENEVENEADRLHLERNDTDISQIEVLVEHPNSAPHEERVARNSLVQLDDDVYYFDIFPVPEAEIIHEGDIMYFTHPKALMGLNNKRLRQGLKMIDSNVFELAGFGTDLVELVISETNPFIGQTIHNSEFAKRYNVSIVALRSRGADDVTHMTDVRTTALRAGDVVLVVANEEAYKAMNGSVDFYVVTRVGSLPPVATAWDYVACLLFVAMLIVVVLDVVPIVQASMTVMIVMVLGGWVPGSEAIKCIDFRLLCLIGSALGFARSIQTSGLDDDIATAVRNADISPQGVIFLVYFVTMCITELVTNNAAAALALPMALKIAENMDLNYQPFAMTVMMAASSSFCTPIGYQTNTMVWGPGGYKFLDFTKIGVPVNIIYMVVSSLLIPLIWPL